MNKIIITVITILIFLCSCNYANSEGLVNRRIIMSDLYKYNLYIKDTRKIILTAYNALPNQTWGDPNITASNKRIKVGYIAISKDLYKKGWTFGKKVYYNGRIYQIEDILPSRSMGIDIFMVEYEDAINFGKRKGIAHLLYERK